MSACLADLASLQTESPIVDQLLNVFLDHMTVKLWLFITWVFSYLIFLNFKVQKLRIALPTWGLGPVRLCSAWLLWQVC